MQFYPSSRANALLATLVVALVAPASFAVNSFTGIGTLDGGTSQVTAISHNGEVVVGRSASGGHDRAIRWTATDGIVPLGTPGAPGAPGAGASQANANSADGSVIVGRAFNGVFNEAFRWTAGSGMTWLGGFTDNGSEALGVSANGAVVVGYDGLEPRGCSTGFGVSDCPPQIGTEQAFVWREGTGLQQLPNLSDAPFSRAHVVNSDGSLIVGSSFDYQVLSLGSGGVVFTGVSRLDAASVWAVDNTVSAVDFAATSRPLSITSNDEVVFLGRDFPCSIGPIGGPIRSLDCGLGFSTVAGDGETIVGDFSTAVALREEFVDLKPLLMHHFGLDLTGWVLSEATGISADGLTIVGNGANPLGRREGWIARLDAWPSAAELAGVPSMGATESVSPLASAVLPASRSARVGQVVTAFVTLINTEFHSPAIGCRIGLASEIPATLDYHQTDPVTNEAVGVQNTPADLAANGGQQSFVIGITPTSTFDPMDVQLSFDCANSVPALSLLGVNTLSLSASDVPVADVVALVTTTDLVIPLGGSANAAVAVANVGSGSQITATLDTAGAQLPITASICQTNSATGACLEPMAGLSTLSLSANATASFMIQLEASEFVLFDPANTRVFIRFHDENGVLRGATSLAVRAE